MSAAVEERLQGVGELAIFWRAWLPAGSPVAVVAIAHGAGEHSGRYEHVAARLTAEGYAVYALDHRGHGRSEGPRALISRMRDAVSDLESLIALARVAIRDCPRSCLDTAWAGRSRWATPSPTERS